MIPTELMRRYLVGDLATFLILTGDLVIGCAEGGGQLPRPEYRPDGQSIRTHRQIEPHRLHNTISLNRKKGGELIQHIVSRLRMSLLSGFAITVPSKLNHEKRRKIQ